MSVSESETVGPSTPVKVWGLVPGSTTTINFVPENEANYFKRQIPLSSTLADALIGAKVGDHVPLDTLDDGMELEVVDVEPADAARS